MKADPRHLFNVERILTVSIPPAMRHGTIPDGDRWRAMIDPETRKLVPGYSPNQEAMAAVLWLYFDAAGGGYECACDIVMPEVRGEATFQRKELLSNTYQTWKVASVIAIHAWAVSHGDSTLRNACLQWLAACWAFNALGAAPSADSVYQKGFWKWQHEGPWVPSAGMRSTPQHYNTSEMGMLLAKALRLPAKSRTKSWVLEVADIAGAPGLSDSEAGALRGLIAGEKGHEAVAVDLLDGMTFCERFHFTRWRHAVLTWHNRNVNGNTADVKASLWELEGGVGRATHVYPYSDPGERHPLHDGIGEGCRFEPGANVLIANAELEETLELPVDTPIYELTVGAP